MKYRQFGKTGLRVSELGFGAWGIGGDAYGSVTTTDALNALHEAEECGCNLIDTAMTYGHSEEIIGNFLSNRRDRWIVSTKYSGQNPDIETVVEQQLKNLNTDYIDFYQLHWAPTNSGCELYDKLEALKQAGKIRYYGVSLYSKSDIFFLLKNTKTDGFQLKLSLVDTEPFFSCRELIHDLSPGLLIRSSLREGTLTGKFNFSNKIIDSNDQRSKWTKRQWNLAIYEANKFKVLETPIKPLRLMAIAYPLSFPEVSSVLVGCKTASQVRANMNFEPGKLLSGEDQINIKNIQCNLGLRGGWRKYIRKMLYRFL